MATVYYNQRQCGELGIKLPPGFDPGTIHTCGGEITEPLKRVRFCTYCGGLITDPRRANNPRTVYGSDEHRRAAKREDRAVTAGKFCRLCKRPKAKGATA